MRLKTKQDRIDRVAMFVDMLKDKDNFELYESDNFIGAMYTITGPNGVMQIVRLYKKWATKPELNHYVESKDRAIELIQEREDRLKSWEDMKAERRKKATNNTLKIGDILYSSWGYDQTNIDFYQVTELIGKQSVKIKQVASKVLSNSHGQDKVTAVKGAFLENAEEMLKRVSDNSVSLNSYSSARLWDGSPKYETDAYSGH